MTTAVLGGGLAGLSAAYYASKLASGQKIVLLEAANRLGGWIKSEKVDKNVIFEQGPRTIRPKGPAGVNTLNLLEDLGLSAEVVPISIEHPVAKRRLIYANGELHELPNSLASLFGTLKPFSSPLITQVLRDFIAEPKITSDDSIYEFTKRRFGSEIADYLIDPMICGITAGNSREVSVKFIMGKLFQYEQEHGGVLKGFLRHAFDRAEKSPPKGALAQRCASQKWSVYSFREGIETLPVALGAALRNSENVDVQLKAQVGDIQFTDPKRALVHLRNGTSLETNRIISSIPARKLASLLSKQHPELADKLERIKTVTVGVINLRFKGNYITVPAFGFLVPPKEKLPILGVIYDSCCQHSEDGTVLTVMMGGYWFEELFGHDPSEEQLLNVATQSLRSILNISDRPVQHKVNILKDCIPQYVVGHEQNLKDIHNYIDRHKLPLSLCGASYDGVGVNDVILSAKNATEKLL